MKDKIFYLCIALVGLSFSSHALAHDTWIEANARCVPLGDPVYVQVCLGNHANEHRDYRLASALPSLEGLTLEALDAAGNRIDLSQKLKRFGTTEKEGTWIGQWIPPREGRYWLKQRLDILHGKFHVIHNGLAAIEIGNSPQQAAPSVPISNDGLEFVPLNPVDRLKAGKPFELQLLFDGKPKPETVVSLLPLGESLKSEFDERFEYRTDSDGKVTLNPTTANRYLLVAHHRDEAESGDGFAATAYTATLHLQVAK